MIFLVDDDTKILDAYSSLLDLHGYQVFACSCPQEALHQYKLHKDSITSVVTDNNLPEVTGDAAYSSHPNN